MRTAEIVTAVLLGLLSIYLMWKSGEPPAWNPEAARFDNIWFIEDEGPGSGFWPFWLSAVMLGCCLWTSWNWYRKTSPQSRSKARFLSDFEVRALIYVCGGLLGFLLLIGVVGYYGAMFLFLLYYIRAIGRHRLSTSLAISTAVPVVAFFFFDVAMRIVLPKGLLEPAFVPLYDIFL